MCALHTYTYIYTLSALVLCTLCFSNSEKWSCKKLWNKICGLSSLSLIFLSQWFQTAQGNIHSFSQQLYEADYTKLGFTHYAKSHFVQPQKNMFIQGLATSYCLEITPSCSGIYLVWFSPLYEASLRKRSGSSSSGAAGQIETASLWGYAYIILKIQGLRDTYFPHTKLIKWSKLTSNNVP